MTRDQYTRALLNGYFFDIGQFSPAELRDIKRRVKTGDLERTRAVWPYLLSGTTFKTCYIRKEAY